MEAFERGKLLEKDKRYSAALFCYQSVLKEGPKTKNYKEALKRKLNMLEKLEKYADLIQAINQLLEEEKKNDFDLLFKKLEILKWHSEMLKQHYNVTNEYTSALNLARNLAEEIMIKAPTEPSSYVKLASVLSLQEKHEEFIEMMEAAIDLSVSNKEQMKIYEQMAWHYEEAYENEPNNLDLLRKAVHYYYMAAANGLDCRNYIEKLECHIEEKSEPSFDFEGYYRQAAVEIAGLTDPAEIENYAKRWREIGEGK